MEDIIGDGLVKGLFKLVLTIINFSARVLVFLVIDVCIEIIGWWVGWTRLRVLTFGKYPASKISNYEDTFDLEVFLISLFGLCVLIAIGALSAKLLLAI